MGLLHLGITERKKAGAHVTSASALNNIVLGEIKVKTFGFLYFYWIFVLSLFPRSSYVYTIIARQPTISALNQAIPQRRFALRIQFLLYHKAYLY